MNSIEVWCLDGTNKVHTVWHAVRQSSDPVGATVDSLMNYVRAACHRFSISEENFLVAFDRESVKREKFPDYKAGRPPKESGLRDALSLAEQEIKFETGCPALAAAGFEADDIMATVAHAASNSGRRAVLVSPDKDVLGLPRSGRITVAKGVAKSGSVEWWTQNVIEQKFGFPIERWYQFQAIVGDPSDGIKGWDGVGKETAMKWLANHSLDEIMLQPELVHMNKRQKSGLEEYVTLLTKSLYLVTPIIGAKQEIDVENLVKWWV